MFSLRFQDRPFDADPTVKPTVVSSSCCLTFSTTRPPHFTLAHNLPLLFSCHLTFIYHHDHPQKRLPRQQPQAAYTLILFCHPTPQATRIHCLLQVIVTHQDDKSRPIRQATAFIVPSIQAALHYEESTEDQE